MPSSKQPDAFLVIGGKLVPIPTESLSLQAYGGSINLSATIPCSPEAAKALAALVLLTTPGADESEGSGA